MGARGLLRLLQRAVPAGTGGLRVLCYHLVDAGTGSPVDLPPEELLGHVGALRRFGSPVGLAQGYRAAREGSRDGLVAVTFDDAYRNFLDQAWPTLEEAGIPVTLFVPTGFIDGTSPPPLTGADLEPCSWEQLRELAASELVTIGSHTLTHPDLRRLAPERLRAELRDSRSRLEDQLGVEVTTLCYPRGLWNRRVEREVARVYDLAVVGGGRRVLGRRISPLRLYRTSVRRDAPLPIEQWLKQPIWLEEAAADIVRRLR